MLKQILFLYVLIGNLAHGCQPREWFESTGSASSRGSGSGVKIADFPGASGDDNLPASPKAKEVSVATKATKEKDESKKLPADKLTKQE